MSAYQAKRAEQKARDALKSAGAMKLHRIVDLAADDYCAQEGRYIAHPMDDRPRTDLAGMTFGRLTVLSAVPSHPGEKNKKWDCICACGGRTKVVGYSLRSGNTKSCGCLQRDTVKNLKPRLTHGMSNTSTYNIWDSMIQRCENGGRKDFHRYGGAGIKVCARWKEFANFLADMGERPPGMSLDRYPDNDGNYEPGNCRWATLEQQARNTSKNRLLTAFGETKCIASWADSVGISRKVIGKRLLAGWDVIKAITFPLRKTSRHGK